jgi:hypothetical protein
MFIEHIIEIIIFNKKFPSYQAERRIDIFINFFLEDILKSNFYTDTIKFIAPEFQLRKENGYQSTNIDYLCTRQTSSGTNIILLVELKTDVHSYDAKQHDNYKRFQNWKICFDGLKEIMLHGRMDFSKRLKYFNLIHALYQQNLIQTLSDIHGINLKYSELSKRKSNAITSIEKRDFTRSLYSFLNKTHIEPWLTQIIYIGPKELSKRSEFKKRGDMLIPLEDLHKIMVRAYKKEWKLISQILTK